MITDDSPLPVKLAVIYLLCFTHFVWVVVIMDLLGVDIDEVC